MKYKITVGVSLEALELKVNKYIKAGFEPCGSIFYYDDRICGRCIVQPMLKRTWGAGNAPETDK